MACLLAVWGCSAPGESRDAPPRTSTPAQSGRTGHSGGIPVYVAATPGVERFLLASESAFEAAHPRFDLIIVRGWSEANLDAAQALMKRLDAGEPMDAFLADDVSQLDGLSISIPEEPMAWAANDLIVVAPRRSRLRMIDLSKGVHGIGCALARTPLGRHTEAALSQRGIWDTISERIERFNDGGAIASALAHRADPMLGVVYRSDAAAESGIKAIGNLRLPDDDPIRHVVAWWSDGGRRYSGWLAGDQAHALAQDLGFIPIPLETARPVRPRH